MKRGLLTELVRDAASAGGYAFHAGETHLINGTVRVYPALWLIPPVLRSHTGREEGETVWRITLYLMTMPAGGGSVESVWQRLERDALGIALSLADSSAVCEVANAGCVPAQRSLTVHGEISVALTCDVTIWYYS